jgi:predicted DNA-binding ribbon-helix-helix protein
MKANSDGLPKCHSRSAVSFGGWRQRWPSIYPFSRFYGLSIVRVSGDRTRPQVRGTYNPQSRLGAGPRWRNGRIRGRNIMKSPVVKRSIVIAGHKTSVSLEDAFWDALKEIAAQRKATLSDVVASIDSTRTQGNLSSAIRLFVLDYFRSGNDGAAAAAPNRGA